MGGMVAVIWSRQRGRRGAEERLAQNLSIAEPCGVDEEDWEEEEEEEEDEESESSMYYGDSSSIKG